MATLSEIKLPNVDLSKVEMPALDMSNIDLRASALEAAEAVGLRQPPRRSRSFFAIGGLILAAVASWVVLRSPQVRGRSQQLVSSIRERISSMRPDASDLDGGDPADPIAFSAAETKPIQPDRWNETDDLAAPDYPDGLGSGLGDAGPSRHASKSRA